MFPGIQVCISQRLNWGDKVLSWGEQQRIWECKCRQEGAVNMKSCAWMICGISCTVLDKWTWWRVFGGWIEWDDPVCGSCGPVIHYALPCFVSVNALGASCDALGVSAQAYSYRFLEISVRSIFSRICFVIGASQVTVSVWDDHSILTLVQFALLLMTFIFWLQALVALFPQ